MHAMHSMIFRTVVDPYGDINSFLYQTSQTKVGEQITDKKVQERFYMIRAMVCCVSLINTFQIGLFAVSIFLSFSLVCRVYVYPIWPDNLDTSYGNSSVSNNLE